MANPESKHSSESSDTHFFNSFSVVLGILIVIAIILFAVARSIGGEVQGETVQTDPLHLKDVHTNTAPFAQEAIAGQDNTALAAMSAPKAAPAEEAPAGGEVAFNKVCTSCHSAGINGAPKVGDHAAWAARISQGKETLYSHAINGKGNMPARGGTNWPDATIKATVDYMVGLSK